jgi:hypothetical protein
MKPTNVTGYPFSNGDRLTAVSVNQICNALDAIQDYNDTIKEFEDLVEENTDELKQQISATTETTAAVVRSMDSVSLANDVEQGKSVIAQAINAKGGTASATESFTELAQAVEEIKNYNDYKLSFFETLSTGKNESTSLINVNIAELNDTGVDYNYTIGNCQFYNNQHIKKINISHCTTVGSGVFQGNQTLQEVSISGDFSGGDVFAGCVSLLKVVMSGTIIRQGTFFGCTSLTELIAPNLITLQSANVGNSQVFSRTKIKNLYLPTVTTVYHARGYIFTNMQYLESVTLGTLLTFDLNPNNTIEFANSTKLKSFTVGEGTDVNIPLQSWNPTYVIAQVGGIDELNSNLYNNLLTKLYDHSQDGETRTLRIGWLANVTAENIAYANAKGWTLTT